MKKFAYPVLLTILCVFLFAPKAGAFQCASTGAEFQTALDTAVLGDNEIRLVGVPPGTSYTIPGDVHFYIATAQSLTISGGWNAGCTNQTANPILTSLEGGALQNLETYPHGGGVFLVLLDNTTAAATLSISNLSIRNGWSEGDGGGLSIAHGVYDAASALATLNISNVIVELNTTEELFGSGLAINDKTTDGGIEVNITDSIVKDNGAVASSPGLLPGPGGIFIDNYGLAGGVITLARNQIINNISEADGGGLFINNGVSDLTLVNNVIAGNYSASGFGGGVFIENISVEQSSGGNITLTNNTITGNILAGGAFSAGGGIFVEMDDPASVLSIYNNIIWDNGFFGTPGDGSDIDIFNDNVGIVVNLENNDFNNAQPAGLNILNPVSYVIPVSNFDNVDPLFLNPATDDYHISAASPVIDAGDNAVAPADDLDGNIRPKGNFVDMGAYEFGNSRSLPFLMLLLD